MRIANQGAGQTNAFKLSKEAYQKLTANYNYGAKGKAKAGDIGFENSA